MFFEADGSDFHVLHNNSYFCAIVTDCYAITADDLLDVMTIDDNAWKSCHRDVIFSSDVCLAQDCLEVSYRLHVPPAMLFDNIFLILIDLAQQHCNTLANIIIRDLPIQLVLDHNNYEKLSVISIQQSVVIAQPSVTIAQKVLFFRKNESIHQDL